MRKFGVCLALTGATVWLTGCGYLGGSSSSSSSRGGIAVVDLDKIAQETGKAIEMKEALELTESAMRQQLVAFQTKATAELQAKMKDLTDKGDTATEKEQREVAKFRVDASNLLAQGQNEAGAKLGQIKQNQIAKFRADLKPVLQEVAAKRGMSIVIPKNEGLLLSVDPGVDITDDVIKGYRAIRPAAAPAPAPAKEAAAKPAAPEKRTAAKQAEEFKN